ENPGVSKGPDQSVGRPWREFGRPIGLLAWPAAMSCGRRTQYNVATACHTPQHAKSPLRVTLAVGQREHGDLATERRVIVQAGITSDGAQSSRRVRQARSQADARPTAHAGQDRNVLLPAALVSRHVSDDAGRCFELEELLAGLGIGSLEVT